VATGVPGFGVVVARACWPGAGAGSAVPLPSLDEDCEPLGAVSVVRPLSLDEDREPPTAAGAVPPPSFEEDRGRSEPGAARRWTAGDAGTAPSGATPEARPEPRTGLDGSPPATVLLLPDAGAPAEDGETAPANEADEAVEAGETEEAVDEEAAPVGSTRARSTSAGASPEPLAGVEVRRDTGSVRRCTAEVPVRALVRDLGGDEEDAAGTGVTRTPGAGRGAAAGACVAAARHWGARAAADGAGASSPLPEPDVGTAAPRTRAPDSRAGSARSGTAGVRCTGETGSARGRAPAWRSRPGTGRPTAVRGVSPPRLALARPSSTAGDAVPANDGFCQVGNRPPNPASATSARPGTTAR
jgi:hypothetical protein